VLWTLVLVLGILWALGVFTSYTAGGLIHVLLAFAVIVFVVRMIGGRGRRRP